MGDGNVATFQPMGAAGPAWIDPAGNAFVGDNGSVNFIGLGDPVIKGSKKGWVANEVLKVKVKGNNQANGEMFDGLTLSKPVTLPSWVQQVLTGAADESSSYGFVLTPEVDKERAYLNTIIPTVGPRGELAYGDAILDGLELLCEFDRAHDTSNVNPPSVASIGDIDTAGAFLQNVAKSIERQAAQRIFAKVPRIASDALGQAPTTGAFPALGGDMAEAVIRLRKGLIATKEAMPIITTQLKTMGSEMTSLRAQLDNVEANKDLVDLNLQSSTISLVNSCAQSALSPSSWVTFGAASVVECANSALQINLAYKKKAQELDRRDACSRNRG